MYLEKVYFIAINLNINCARNEMFIYILQHFTAKMYRVAFPMKVGEIRRKEKIYKDFK